MAYTGSDIDCCSGGRVSCFDCAKFSKVKGVCTEGHMGDKPENYDKPKWMGCSWYEDPKKNTLTLFEKENNV